MLDPNFENHEGRGGGRTTRAMVQAVEHVRNYQDVIFLMASDSEARWAIGAFMDLVADEQCWKFTGQAWRVVNTATGGYVQFVSCQSDPLRYLTAPPPPPNLIIDHHTYEVGDPRRLAEWQAVAVARMVNMHVAR